MKTNNIATFTATAPICWASYLINGDSSGLDDNEIEQADAWITRMGGYVSDVGEAEFASRHDAWAECPLAGDVAEYTIIAH